MRVFHDRLVNEGDREVFKAILKTKFPAFELEEAVILNIERIVFGDFMKGIEKREGREYF